MMASFSENAYVYIHGIHILKRGMTLLKFLKANLSFFILVFATAVGQMCVKEEFEMLVVRFYSPCNDMRDW